MLFFCRKKKPYGDSSKTVFREVTPFHLLEVYLCILAHLIYNILSQKKRVLLGFKLRV